MLLRRLDLLLLTIIGAAQSLVPFLLPVVLRHSCASSSTDNRCYQRVPNTIARRPKRTLLRNRTYGSSMDGSDVWLELSPDALVSAPCLIEQTLCQQPPPDSSVDFGAQPPQLAGTLEYASAILDAWRDEATTSGGGDTGRLGDDIEWKRVTYSDCHGTALYGHVIRNKPRNQSSSSVGSPALPVVPVPPPTRVILFFPTAAGPHDIFLLWKAASLIRSLKHNSVEDRDTDQTVHDTDTAAADAPETNHETVWVMIADLLSDATGWGWDTINRTRYTTERTKLLQHNINANPDDNPVRLAVGVDRHGRILLQDRIQAALDYIHANLVAPEAASASSLRHMPPSPSPRLALAVLGWCLGGQAVAELGRMMGHQHDDRQNCNRIQDSNNEEHAWDLLPRVQCMVTFHGVFTDLEPEFPMTDSTAAVSTRRNGKGGGCEILVCHGVKDPFVPSSDIEAALALFQRHGHTTALLQLKEAKHGFTNPAQEFNPQTEAFGYHAESADKAWRQTLALLRRRLSL